jgi:two-component system chemotaxis response regulator CheB
MRRWRCYLGHVHGARQMLDAGNEQLEAALWSAVRALHERAATWETLAQDARQEQRDLVATEYATKAREARDQAELARRFMLDLLLREP